MRPLVKVCSSPVSTSIRVRQRPNMGAVRRCRSDLTESAVHGAFPAFSREHRLTQPSLPPPRKSMLLKGEIDVLVLGTGWLLLANPSIGDLIQGDQAGESARRLAPVSLGMRTSKTRASRLLVSKRGRLRLRSPRQDGSTFTLDCKQDISCYSGSHARRTCGSLFNMVSHNRSPTGVLTSTDFRWVVTIYELLVIAELNGPRLRFYSFPNKCRIAQRQMTVHGTAELDFWGLYLNRVYASMRSNSRVQDFVDWGGCSNECD